MVADTGEGDDVQRPVELAVAAAVEPMTSLLPLEASTGLVPASAAKEASLVIRLGSPLETSSWAAQTGPTPHSSSRSGATSTTSAARARSASCISFESRSTRWPSRRRTQFITSGRGRSRAAAWASRSPESAPRRERR